MQNGDWYTIYTANKDSLQRFVFNFDRKFSFEQRCIVCAKLNENSNHLFIFYFFFLSIFFFVLGLRRAHFLCERREIISTIIRWVRYHCYFLSPCDWMRATQPNNEEKNTINFKTFDMLYWNEFSRKTILQAPFFFGCCSFSLSFDPHLFLILHIYLSSALSFSLYLYLSMLLLSPLMLWFVGYGPLWPRCHNLFSDIMHLLLVVLLFGTHKHTRLL